MGKGGNCQDACDLAVLSNSPMKENLDSSPSPNINVAHMLVVEMRGKGFCWPGQILKLEFLETLLLQKAKDSLSYSVTHIWPQYEDAYMTKFSGVSKDWRVAIK